MARYLLLISLSVWVVPTHAFAWFDETHSAIMRAAESPYSSCLAVTADALVEKLPTESANHWVNGTPSDVVTEARVLDQVARYNTEDPKGHLYGAVIAAYRRVHELVQQGRRPAYAYGYLAHYIGDLSQPLHQSVNDAFNKAHHIQSDGIVNDKPDLEAQIRQRMVPLEVSSEGDVVREVVLLANASRALDAKMRAGAPLSEDEAFHQLARSATLLHAVTVHLGLKK